MSTYTGVTNFQKQSGFVGPPCIYVHECPFRDVIVDAETSADAAST